MLPTKITINNNKLILLTFRLFHKHADYFINNIPLGVFHSINHLFLVSDQGRSAVYLQPKMIQISQP